MVKARLSVCVWELLECKRLLSGPLIKARIPPLFTKICLFNKFLLSIKHSIVLHIKNKLWDFPLTHMWYDSYTMHLMNLGSSILKYWEADKICTRTQKEMEDQETLWWWFITFKIADINFESIKKNPALFSLVPKGYSVIFIPARNHQLAGRM